MKWRLSIFEEDYRFFIAWDDDGFPGAYLGDNDVDAWDHQAATKAVKNSCPMVDHLGRFYWDSKSSALKAIRIARLAIKSSKENRPWPSWALMAKSEGWTPPKGWVPSREDGNDE